MVPCDAQSVYGRDKKVFNISISRVRILKKKTIQLKKKFNMRKFLQGSCTCSWSSLHYFAAKTAAFQVSEYEFHIYPRLVNIGHVNEYPTMHYFGFPRHTSSMIAYKILTECF